MIIMGIDGSTKNTGIAIFKDSQLIYSNYIAATSNDLISRINKMVDSLKEILQEYNETEKIIMEEVLPDKAKGNIKTHKALMWLQGAIAIMIHNKFPKTQIEYIMPNSWRAQVGIHTGRSVKRAELKAADIQFVKEHFNKDVNDDEADAILIAYSYIIKNENAW